MGKGKYTLRSIVVRCLVIMIGVVICGFGAACYVTANLGSDPVTAFVQGLGNVFHLSFGMAMNVFNAACFLLILIFNRKLINIGTILYTFSLGFFSDMFISLLNQGMGTSPGLAIRIVVIIAGTLGIGIGLGLYQSSEFGIGPSDALNQTISAKTKIPLRWERIIFDGVMVLGGFLMGGVVFVGTILGMLAVGPIMAPTITACSKLVNRWAGGVPAE